MTYNKLYHSFLTWAAVIGCCSTVYLYFYSTNQAYETVDILTIMVVILKIMKMAGDYDEENRNNLVNELKI